MNERAPKKRQTIEILIDRGIPIESIIDVGVLTATPELIRFFPFIKHYLFEPVKEFHSEIEKNYHKLDFELFGIAVSDSCGKANLKTRSLHSGKDITHSSIVVSDSNDESVNAREVDITTLDVILSNYPEIQNAFLKIDVDGQELKVIAGALETLKRCSVVMVECQRRTLVERISAIQAEGFELFDLTGPCYYDKALWQCDAVLLRKDIFNKYFRKISGPIQPGMYETFR